MNKRGIAIVALLAFITACAPLVRAPGEAIKDPALTDKGFLTADGEILPYKNWTPDGGKAKATLIALHGFNDYSNFFTEPGAYLAKQGIRSYAYDQRGFGAAPGHGLWPGTKAFSDDLKMFTTLIRKRHPEAPVYLLGESMGGAVIMNAATGENPPHADGVILAAPAVWGRITMPWYQRLGLWIGVRLMPGVTMTGEGLNIMPSDNREMLLALGRDPLVIKATRVDAMYGLTNLMDQALENSSRFGAPALIMPALIMYGQKDEIIPKKPTRIMLRRLPQAPPKRRRIAVYENGYHMLLRDLQGETLWRDIAHWIADKETPLPSGADVEAETRLAGKNGPAKIK
ncbi:MAG: alpha/beta hydrolase [Rhodospirillales bacterium]|nr:alpha/beta hydrolase [Rhodospirillales bacterium]